MTVIADILFTLTSVGVEFAVSMKLSSIYVRLVAEQQIISESETASSACLGHCTTYGSDWLLTFLQDNLLLSIFFIYCRSSFISATISRFVTLNLTARQGKPLSNLYSTILTLFFLQIAVAPFLLNNSLWTINNLQMLIVIS